MQNSSQTRHKYKIIQGDCVKVLHGLPDKSIDLVLTDPPYGIGINKMSFVTSGAVKAGVTKRTDFSDHNTEWDKQGLTLECFKEMQRVSKNQIIFGGNYFSFLPESSCWIIWDKRCNDKYTNDFADCELAWTSFNKPSRVVRYLWSGMLQENMKRKEKRHHPTQKPVKVLEWILERFSEPTDVICDPFLGSGSTMLACQNKKRECVGIEIESQYVEIAKKRCFSRTFLDHDVSYDFENPKLEAFV